MNSIFKYIEEYKMVEKSAIYKRGEILATPGDVNTSIYWIKSGTVKISVFDNDEERITRFGYKNDLIVMLDSFLTHQPTDFLMQAIKKTEVNLISQKTWNDFLKRDFQHVLLWNKMLEQLIVQQLEREKDLLIASPQERLQRVLERSPHLFQEIPKKHIASYLRMTPETLSRIKNLD